MDKKEAKSILGEHLVRCSGRGYAELVSLVQSEHEDAFEAVGPSGTRYQVEVQFLWDDQPGGVIRVLASIDDGGLRAYLPVTESLLVAPPGG